MNEKVKLFYRELQNNLNNPDLKQWRYGQTVFNKMHQLYPVVADKFRGSTIDHFTMMTAWMNSLKNVLTNYRKKLNKA